MINWKTTVSAVVAGIAQILRAFKVEIDPVILDGITALAVIALGIFAKDSNVTGGTKTQ